MKKDVKNKDVKMEETKAVTSEASEQPIAAKMTLDGVDLSEFEPEEADITIPSKIKPTQIPIKRRDDQTWVQFHPTWNLRLNCIKRTADGSYYPVLRAALPYCKEWVKPYTFFVGITTSNTVFLLDVPDDSDDDKGFGKSWHDSARITVIEGRKGWIRVVSNRSAGGYDIKYPEGKIGNPTWPDVTLQEILDIAFRDRIIKDGDHKLIKDLRGQQLL